MVKVNGKEYGLIYTVGARLNYEQWLIKNTEAPMTLAYLKQAIWMSEAYCKTNGGEPLTMEMLTDLPASEAVKIIAAAKEQVEKDSEITVAAKPKNGKKAAK